MSKRNSMTTKNNSGIILWGTLALIGLILAVLVVTVVNAEKSKLEELGTSIPDFVTAEGAVLINQTSSETPDAARLDVFFDFSCPACANADQIFKDTIDEYLENDEIQLYLNPLSFMDAASPDNFSTRAASHFLTVFEHNPDKALEFVSVLFQNQPSGMRTSNETFVEYAKQAGVSEEAYGAFKNEAYTQWVLDNTTRQGERVEIFAQGISTPTYVVGSNITDGKTTDFNKLVLSEGDPLTILKNAIKAENDKITSND